MLAKTIFSLAGKRVWVAGHNGMVGAALVRRLGSENCEIITVDRDHVDLTSQSQTRDWMLSSKPDAVFVAAARVGGILANQMSPADFLYDNLMIETNIVHTARSANVSKLLVLGSSCIYPKMAPQPIPEEALLAGPLEPTNEYYAVAKIVGIKLCQAYRAQYGCDFISAMPANLYGPGDDFDLLRGHVIPALMRKAHEAKMRGDRELIVWGTGTPRREFLHVDDCADACVTLMKVYSGAEQINVGSGNDITIADLAHLVAEVVGFTATIKFDATKPDGTPRKLLDTRKLNAMDWRPRISLGKGLAATYTAFKSA